MTTHDQHAAMQSDPHDISLDWLFQYEHLVARVSARFASYIPNSRDDLMQECRIALLNARDKYDPRLGFAFEAYATKVLTNAAKKYLNLEMRRGFRGQTMDPNCPPPRMVSVAPDSGGLKPILDRIADESKLPTTWDQKTWDEVFGHLSRSQVEVLTLRLFKDLTYREVGHELGFRESRANFLYHEAIRKLQSRQVSIDDL